MISSAFLCDLPRSITYEQMDIVKKRELRHVFAFASWFGHLVVCICCPGCLRLCSYLWIIRNLHEYCKMSQVIAATHSGLITWQMCVLVTSFRGPNASWIIWPNEKYEQTIVSLKQCSLVVTSFVIVVHSVHFIHPAKLCDSSLPTSMHAISLQTRAAFFPGWSLSQQFLCPTCLNTARRHTAFSSSPGFGTKITRFVPSIISRIYNLRMRIWS